MATASIQVSETPLVLYALRRADDALILGHRLSEWCGHAPMLEEDMALANMGLDLLGQARELYSYAAKVEGKELVGPPTAEIPRVINLMDALKKSVAAAKGNGSSGATRGKKLKKVASGSHNARGGKSRRKKSA